MENQNISNPLFDLSIDENVRQSIRGAAVAGGIAAILSLVIAISNVLTVFIAKKPLLKQTEGFEKTETPEMIGGFIGLAIALLISILLFYFLNKFARQAKAGIDTNNPRLVSEGLGGLSVYFRFMGVLLILAMTILVLVYLAVSLGSAVI